MEWDTTTDIKLKDSEKPQWLKNIEALREYRADLRSMLYREAKERERRVTKTILFIAESEYGKERNGKRKQRTGRSSEGNRAND